MDLIEVIKTIIQMAAEGVIGRYAIGGAVGATFYLEPVSTLGLDVFVDFGQDSGSLNISPNRMYEYLTARGGVIEGEYIVLSDWPVQFLPPTGPLIEEALSQAVEMDLAGTTIRVFTKEHLAAIALQTGRAKDKARLLQFLEAGTLESEFFQDIIHRHGLEEAWMRFQKQFLTDQV